MRSIYRTLNRNELTGIAAVCLAVGMIGVSYGATAVTSGLPFWLPLVLSVLVLAGGSELLFVGIVAAGGSVIAAVLAGLLVNARHLPYGLSLPDVVGTGRRRLLGTHIMNDESVAVSLAQPDRARRRAAYWMCGLGVLLAWPVGALLGVVIGAAVPDPDAFGLDAVFPAVLVALVLPAIRGDRATRWSALLGAVVAAATAPLLTAGLPVLVALPVALLVAMALTRNPVSREESVADTRCGERCSAANEPTLAEVDELAHRAIPGAGSVGEPPDSPTHSRFPSTRSAAGSGDGRPGSPLGIRSVGGGHE
ncbi:AzlC family ABC transporter permease [Nocardia aurantia]|uniref:Branched-chain amino acid permease n=1 Tax=Nocardia aurantia TaxID=2585199 RepID=A0A7K0DMB7_9NOCA|nr:hypothetical protein [Nocardia aurantia]